tara:strand:+ start:420 stop:656 length:237 start_codon:yes stop_codon:yes gene_type:complete
MTCDSVFNFYHAIGDKKTYCTECNTEDSLQIQICKFNLYTQEKNNKVGNLVKQSIEDFSEELKQEKDKLRNEFYEPDE